jgi:hypothetical protein
MHKVPPPFSLVGFNAKKKLGCESFLPQDNNGAKSHGAHFPKEKDHVHDKARRKRFSITLA